MKLLYIDESYDKKNYVLCGFLINDINYRKLNTDFSLFLKEEFEIEEDQELKGYDLFNAQEFWKGKDIDERSVIVCKVFDFLKATTGTQFLLGSSIINENNQDKLYFKLLEKIVEKSAKIVSKVGKTNKQLLIVFDERQDFRKEKKVHHEIAKKKLKIIKKHKRSCTIIDYGYEGISEFSRMLQIADFVAYFFRNYCSMVENPSLFEGFTNKKKIDMLKNIFLEKIISKCQIIVK